MFIVCSPFAFGAMKVRSCGWQKDETGVGILSVRLIQVQLKGIILYNDI